MASSNIGNIGVSHPRRDLPEKLTGAATYTADVRLPGMLLRRDTAQPVPPRPHRGRRRVPGRPRSPASTRC